MIHVALFRWLHWMWYIGTDRSIEVRKYKVFFSANTPGHNLPFILPKHSFKTRPLWAKGSEPHKRQPLPIRQWISLLWREASKRVFVPHPWNVPGTLLEMSSTWSDLAWKMFAAFMNMPDSGYFCRLSSQSLLSCAFDQSLPHPVNRTSVFLPLCSFVQCHIPSFHQFSWVWVPSWPALLFICMVLSICWHRGSPSAKAGPREDCAI